MLAFARSLRPASLLAGLAELLLPARCPACDASTDEEEPFCADCARAVDPIWSACPRCALPLPRLSTDALTPPCLACLRRPPPWQSARSPFAFTGELATAIRRWKLGADESRTRPLARLLAPWIPVEADALIPVPLHPRRLRSRGFNQASLLAREARSLVAPARPPPVEEWLHRTRDTPPQSSLDAATRHANLRGAFVVPHPERVAGRHVVLVDDVLTTGATATACTRVLLAAGAVRVDVLTLARTLP